MTHTWWYLARSSGLVAWALLAATVVWGLLLATRVLDRTPSPKWLNDLHRFLAGIAVVFTFVHVGTLVADSYVHFSAADVLVPFVSSWRPVAVAWGVITLWLLVAVEVSSLLMKHLPRRLWRAIHLTSFALFVAATAHAFAAGSDVRNQLFVLSCTAVMSVVGLLILVRVAAGKRPRRPNRSIDRHQEPVEPRRVSVDADVTR
jgi:sulfoxide reductase heme-binding subunit YedZ